MEIFKVGFALGKNRGCENFFENVLEKLKDFGSNESGKLVNFSLLNFKKIVEGVNNFEEAEFLISEGSTEAFEKNFKCFFLGGDESVCFPICNSFIKSEENPLILVFDAYANCSNKKVRSWIRRLIEKGFHGRNIILISARDFSEGEVEYLKKEGVNWIRMGVLREDLEGVCDLIMERSRASSGFFMSINFNCLDPCFSPGSNYLVPGGLSSNNLFYILWRMSLLKNFKGALLFGVNPYKDVNDVSSLLCAKFLAELIC